MHSRTKIGYIGVALILIGLSPIFIAELLRKFGFDTVGFALMWGLSFGLFFTVGGIMMLLFLGASAKPF